MSRPVIGLTTYLEPARFGFQDTESAALPRAYLRGVHDSGGTAVLLTPDAPDTGVLNRLDALILTGGGDIGPDRYGQPPHPTTTSRPERDAAELLFLHAALAAGMPVLGICRGMQLMVVAAGGQLHQHLPEVLGHDGHRPVTGPRMGTPRIRLAPGSAGHALLGDEITASCFHHQGIADPGRLVATGWSVADDLVEVVEDPAHPFALGVQWHVEETPDRRLFAALVDAAARAKVR